VEVAVMQLTKRKKWRVEEIEGKEDEKKLRGNRTELVLYVI
jgi:hypothetical protein